MGPLWRFNVLGPLRIERDGDEVVLTGTLPRTLLALLLMGADRPQPPALLIELLWEEHPPAQAKSAFHVHLSKLRRLLGPLLLRTDGGYQLDRTAYTLDAVEFLALSAAGPASGPAETGAALRRALGLWRGDALADLPAHDALDAWRRELDARRVETAVLRVDADLALGGGRELTTELTRLVAANPYDEKLAGQLMVALYRSGRQADALASFDWTRRTLSDELGLEPGESLKRLQSAILAQEPTLMPADVGLETGGAACRPVGGAGPEAKSGQAAPPMPLPSRLPRPLTKLVGRERDLADLEDLSGRADCRLVTLTGPGGVGKTRLGLEHGRGWAAGMHHGALLVELAPLSDASQVGAAIATALAQTDPRVEPTELGLGDSLARREMLLVLDNFEHVLDAAPLVADLLQQAPDLKVLTTSRSPLRIRGEHVFGVAPLSVSAAGDPAGGAAVELFFEGALAVAPRLRADPGRREMVAEICLALDGLPLAVELAAARTATLSLEELHDALARPLSIGGQGFRDLPVRQRSLDAVIAWSYDLLSPSGRAALLAAAVFAGSFSADAMAAVLDRPAELQLEELLGASLLRVSPGGGRWALLELVRAFGLERLSGDPAIEATCRTRHRRYFSERYRHVLEDRRPEDIGRVARERGPDHADLRAAADHAIAAADADGALPLLLAIQPIWMAGHLAESGEITERALAACSFAPADEMDMLTGVCFANAYRPEGETWSQRSAERSAELGRTIVAPTVNLISVALDRCDWKSALHYRDQLLTVTDLEPLSPGMRIARDCALSVCAYLEDDLGAALIHADNAVAHAARGAHLHTEGGARVTRLFIASAATGEIPLADLKAVVEIARTIGLQDQGVAALWMCARYAVSVDPAVAADLLGRATRHAVAAGVDAWPEIEARDETLALLGVEAADALAETAPDRSLADSLAWAAAWLETRPADECAPRDRLPPHALAL